nr:retrovirus-related Pol polyprotein from transposon TNT 1-94 [Tanacetum cinerariifolium]
LKKLKFHLASFDMVVKEGSTATAITKRTWGFEHTKACCHDDIIPFVKALKELFTSFDQCLIDEVTEVQHTYKQLYDSIKSSRVRSKEQCDDLINKVNLKSAKVSDLNASLQEKVLVITALKEQLNKLKGKAVLTKVVSLNPIDPELLKVDVAPLVPKLRKNRTAHTDYIRQTQEEAATLREIIESERLLSPLNTSLDYALTPKNKTKQIRPTEQITKLGKTTVNTPPSANLDSNIPVLSSTGVILVSNASGSMHPRPSPGFGIVAINHLARQGLVRGLSKLKFEKDHLCSACAMGKSTKKTHKPKSEDTNQEKLYLPHMDLCGPIRVERVNEKKYILVRLNVPVRRIRTDNGTEFVNQRLHDYYEEVVISHETSVTRSPQQNGVIERRNRTLIEAACTIENLGKLQPKADIGIFIGYAPSKKAFRIYNQRTRRIVKTIHVDFDELTAMASEQRSSGPALIEMTPGTITSEVIALIDDVIPPKQAESTRSPSSTIVDQDAPSLIIVPIAEVVAPKLAASTGSRSSITIEQDAPSPSNSQTRPETQTPVISNDVEEDNHDLDVAHMNNDPFFASVARSPQQNGVVERRNRTLIEAARTMLIYAQALLFLWAEVVATACFTQNRSIIRLRYGKTPYELMHGKQPDLSFFHVFGALCYPTNDSENIDKLQPKADIGIFIGYAQTKKAFRIYNRRTRHIVETIHVDFDELTAMASEQRSL